MRGYPTTAASGANERIPDPGTFSSQYQVLDTGLVVILYLPETNLQTRKLIHLKVPQILSVDTFSLP